MKSETRNRILYVAADYVATTIAMVVFNILRYEYFSLHWSSLESFLLNRSVLLGIFTIPVMMLSIYYLSGYYYNVIIRSRLEEIVNTLATSFIGALLIYFVVVVNDAVVERGAIYEFICSLWLILFSCLYIFRLTITLAVVRNGRFKRVGFETLIIGTSTQAVNMADKLRRMPKSFGFNVLGFVDIGEKQKSPSSLAGLPVYPFDTLAETCNSLKVKKLIVVDHKHGLHATLDIIEKVFPLGLSIFVSPFLFQKISGKMPYRSLLGDPLVDISHPDISDMTVTCKRAADIVCSAIALIVLAPVMVAIGIAVKLDSKGPIFYLQERVGLHKRLFKIIKFRTMVTDAEANGPALSSADDPRVTRIGRFLRKYRLDEFPQFFNVLKGDMSLVGPRPERPYYVDQIVERVPYYSLIHSVRPGITSLGMVKYGYATEVSQMVERLRYDLIYIENVSAALDMKIIIYTVRTILTGRGV